MISFKSLQTKLYVTYSLVLVVIAFIISTPMYMYLKNNIETNIKENFDQIVSGYSDSIDVYSTISNNVTTQLYMNRDNSNFTTLQYLNTITHFKDSSPNEILLAEKSIQNYLYLNAAIYQTIYRINLFTPNGKFFSTDKADADIMQTIAANDGFFKKVQAAKGSFLLDFSEKDRWLTSVSSPVFSFIRQISWDSKPVGFLEIQFQLSDLLHIEELELDAKQDRQLIILQDGEVLYSSKPLSLEHSSQGLSTILTMMGNSKTGNGFMTNDHGKNNFFMYRTSKKTGITIVVTIPKAQLFAPLQLFRNVTLSSVFLLIAISVFVYFILAKILTHPLKKLKKAIDSINLGEKNEAYIDNKFNMGEIQVINRSFIALNQRLQESLEETVQFRTLQLQAKFDVLQAHINPHFLFNMLGVITVLSDRGQQQAVSETSRKLSQFLRYSISSGSSITTINEEIEFAKHYLDLLKSRYQHRLHYEITVPELLSNIPIPKLFIQPLIENCIQHGFSDADKQLSIQIRGTIVKNQWEISILDNGIGFTQEALTSLNCNIQDYLEKLQNSQSVEEPITIGGMGLVNTIARLQLMYKEQYHFSFGNNEAGGAYVCFKGFLKH